MFQILFYAKHLSLNSSYEVMQGEKHITIWDEKVKEIQKYKIGDQILLKNVTLKQNNGRTELHANGHCAIEQIK